MGRQTPMSLGWCLSSLEGGKGREVLLLLLSLLRCDEEGCGPVCGSACDTSGETVNATRTLGLLRVVLRIYFYYISIIF